MEREKLDRSALLYYEYYLNNMDMDFLDIVGTLIVPYNVYEKTGSYPLGDIAGYKRDDEFGFPFKNESEFIKYISDNMERLGGRLREIRANFYESICEMKIMHFSKRKDTYKMADMLKSLYDKY